MRNDSIVPYDTFQDIVYFMWLYDVLISIGRRLVCPYIFIHDSLNFFKRLKYFEFYYFRSKIVNGYLNYGNDKYRG